MKKHIITIAGNNGGGKSTAATKVAKLLGYTHKSTGDFMRAMAKERGISLEELGEIAENDPRIDQELDNQNKQISLQENVVLDSRLGFHFIPQSFKVFLLCDPQTAATRILKDTKSNPNRLSESKEQFNSAEVIADAITKRLSSERKRYSDLYGIANHTAPENYDLVINTALPENSIEYVPEIIIKAYKKFLEF